MSSNLEDPLRDPRLLPYLPMLHIAWADGALSIAEIRTICAQVEADADGYRCADLLTGFLDPEQPPSAQQLQDILHRIRDSATELSPEERLDLSQLGQRLLPSDRALSDAEMRALQQLEAALGVVGPEAARRLLGRRGAGQTHGSTAPSTASFSPEHLAHVLAEPHGGLRRRLLGLLERENLARAPELPRPAYRQWVLDACHKLADAGFGGQSYPPVYGGGGNLGAFVATFETLAFGDLSLLVKFGVQFGLFGGSILQLGTDRHHHRYLRDVAALALPGCFAMTETGHGSNVRDVETRARYLKQAGVFEIHTPTPEARKDYIGNAAAHGRLATVFAQLEIPRSGGSRQGSGVDEHGVHAFLVPIRDARGQALPGVTIEDCGRKLGLEGVDNGRLTFQRVRVPRENLLDRFGAVSADGEYSSPIPSPGKRFFTMLGTLVGGRVAVACAGVSVAKSALTIAVRYALRRRQFGPEGGPEIVLLDYRSHQHRLLPRLATTYALHYAMRHLAAKHAQAFAAESPGQLPSEHTEDRDAARREVESLAAGLKAYSTWHATDTVQECREACGGQGYLAINRFASLKADSDIFTTFEGDNTVLLQLVAKGLLSAFRKSFENLSFFDLVRHLADLAGTELDAQVPALLGTTDPAKLRDRRGFQLATLRWREQHLLIATARALSSRLKRGMDSFDAFLECQGALLELSKAHVERLVLEQFDAALEDLRDRGTDASLLETLDRVAHLYAVARLEADRGWFLEQQYLAPSTSLALREQVDALCSELRPQAGALVDAFGIPGALLSAPIAL